MSLYYGRLRVICTAALRHRRRRRVKKFNVYANYTSKIQTESVVPINETIYRKDNGGKKKKKHLPRRIKTLFFVDLHSAVPTKPTRRNLVLR